MNVDSAIAERLWGRCASCLLGIEHEAWRCPGCGSRRIVELGAAPAGEVIGIPPTPPCRRQRGWVKVFANLYPDEAAAIDELARVKRCSRSDALRRAVRAYFWGRTEWDKD